MEAIQYYGTGKRKASVARVYLKPGTGKFTVNSREFDEYFQMESKRMLIRQPLQLTDTSEKFDVAAYVRGGGSSGQAGAVCHGISRALVKYNNELRKKLKQSGFLKRDARIKERKKYGQRGARARFQFSKR